MEFEHQSKNDPSLSDIKIDNSISELTEESIADQSEEDSQHIESEYDLSQQDQELKRTVSGNSQDNCDLDDNDMKYMEFVNDSEEFWDDDGFCAPPSQSTPVKSNGTSSNTDKSISKNSTDNDLSRTQDHSYNDSSLFDELTSATGSTSQRTSIVSLSESETDSTLHRSGVSRMSSHMSMDYDYEWEIQKAALKEITDNVEDSSSGSGRDRIILHELSFDEGGKVAGPELYAPVFLAVTEDNDDEELACLRKTHKTQSLEDLLEVLDREEKVVLKRHSKTPPPRLPSRVKTLTPPIEEHNELPLVDENDISFEEDFSLYPSISEEYPVPGELKEGVSNVPVIDDDEVLKEESSQSSQAESTLSSLTSKPEHVRLKNHPQPKRSRKLPETPVVSKKKSKERDSTSSLTNDEAENRVGRWYTVVVNTRNKTLDLDRIEPYMKVLSHGGYCNDGRSVIVTFMACYLPDRHINDYEYIMEQLFFYVVSTVDLLATREDYVLVYFNGGARNTAPGLSWLRKYYTQVDKSLKKSLDSLYIVHPDLWLKTMVRLFKPFISSSFSQRLHFVKTVRGLSQHIPTDYIFIPDEVMSSDPDYLRYHGK